MRKKGAILASLLLERKRDASPSFLGKCVKMKL